ncbi:MAG TPA: hypothetical protein VFH95_11845 [Candidatus Kapabacteria bacterium]|nr:hypothetical protein [Candidatus Kapabacteria bacterium]
MKKLTMILLAAGAIAFGTYAATAGARHFSPEKRVEHLKKTLNLSDAQAAQITTIFKEHQPEMKADRDAARAAAKGSDAKKAAFQKMRADRAALQAQITPVLTADQQVKWNQMMAKHEHEHDKDGSEAAPAQK